MKARNNKSTLKRLSRDILSQRYLFALATVWDHYSSCLNGLLTYLNW